MRAPAFAGLEACVHCGFCLPSCPTFLVTGDESDSPRGRIVLMRALARGRLDPGDAAAALHLERCLGCRACEPVCPSGVSYAPALEEARRLLAEQRGVPWQARLAAEVMADPVLRPALLAVARWLRPLAAAVAGNSSLGFLAGMLSATRPRWRAAPAGRRAERQGREPAGDGATGPAGGAGGGPASPGRSTSASPRIAALFRGCIMDGLFAQVHRATEGVLRANGYRLVDVAQQTCCGALHQHAGLHQEALRLAEINLAAFDQVPEASVVVNSAGCGAMLKAYPRLLAGSPRAAAAAALASRVVDVSEALVAVGPRPGAPLPLRVAYDPPCHLLHAQGIADAPLRMLEAVPGLERVAHREAEVCCGSAGSYWLTQPELSRSILARKVAALREASPDVVVTGNPGCIMQLGAGLAAAGNRIPVVHPVELLDRSYRMAGYYSTA